MSSELSNCAAEIKAFNDERTQIQELIDKNKTALSQVTSTSDRERLVGEIGKSQARLEEISLLLNGLEQRKAKIEDNIKAANIKDQKLRVRRIDLELVQAQRNKWSLLKQLLAAEDKILQLEDQRRTENVDVKLNFPGLDDIDLTIRLFSLRSYILKGDIFETKIPEMEKALDITEEIISKEIKETH